ncbi:MAG: hypothetical protein GX448_18090 [Planctomycetes bacterium]|nr:hypothetical protein [Planctomycetota bacterium]
MSNSVRGNTVDGKPGYASQCVRCGKCLEKCPQQIRIPDRLAEVAADMDGPELGRVDIHGTQQRSAASWTNARKLRLVLS